MRCDTWFPNFINISPAYEIFSWLPEVLLNKKIWPELEEYNALLTSRRNREETKIKFIPQSEKSSDFSRGYEPRIYLTGEVQTRRHNWHDFFNMLIWCTFPQLKTSLNHLQYHELLKRVGTIKQRSTLENFLTLFDENGVIIVSSDPDLLQLIRKKNWKEFFWQQREKILAKVRCYIVGHSLHEKLLNPYIGMVGHSVLLEVSDIFIQQSISQQLTQLEKMIIPNLSAMNSKMLCPIPLLGFPRWHKEAENATFYDDKTYFRS